MKIVPEKIKSFTVLYSLYCTRIATTFKFFYIPIKSIIFLKEFLKVFLPNVTHSPHVRNIYTYTISRYFNISHIQRIVTLSIELSIHKIQGIFTAHDTQEAQNSAFATCKEYPQSMAYNKQRMQHSPQA